MPGYTDVGYVVEWYFESRPVIKTTMSLKMYTASPLGVQTATDNRAQNRTDFRDVATLITRDDRQRTNSIHKQRTRILSSVLIILCTQH